MAGRLIESMATTEALAELFSDTSVLQAMLDGFVLRYRMRDHSTSHWEGLSIFADAVIAFILGAVDWDLTGQPSRTVLDTLIRPWTPIRFGVGRRIN